MTREKILHGKGSKKRWSNPIGDANKMKIIKIIADSLAYGRTLYQHEIIKLSGLSRQTVYTILKELIFEEKVVYENKQYNLSGYYYMDNFLFAYFLKRYLVYKISNMESLSNLSIEVSRSNLGTKDGLARKIFEFANMIGAFIMYVLIESKSPYEKDLGHRHTIESNEELIRRAIPLEEILIGFNRLFGRKLDDRHYNRFDIETFMDLAKEYSNIYPSLYTELESGWKIFCRKFINKLPFDGSYKNCCHKWNELSLYKFRTYYECLKCHMMAEQIR
jgi:hypothetical protein